MTQRTNPDDDLGRWLHDGPTEAPAALAASIRAGVAVTDQRTRRGWDGWRHSTLALAQAAAGVAIVAGLGLGVYVLAGGGGPGAAASPSSMPAAIASASASAALASAAPASSTVAPVASPTASAQGVATTPPSAHPSFPPLLQPTPACGPANTTARITSWQGAMGQRIATVVLTNTSKASCTLPAQSRPQLIDGSGRVLIDSPAAAKSTAIILGAGKHFTTLVQDGNYCGPAPSAPVRIGITLSAGERVIASAPTPNDATVPPCNGTAVQAYIQMHPWSG